MGFRYFLLIVISLAMLGACGSEAVQGDGIPKTKPVAEIPLKEIKPVVTPSEISPEAENSVKKDGDDQAKTEERSPVESATAKPESRAIEKAALKAKAEKADKKSNTSPKARVKKKARMTFSEPVFNYGKIEQGDVVMHSFEFVNTGKQELVIADIRASCGCTQPTYPFLPIAPGEKGVIGVKFDSKGKLGKMKPMVTITTNADPAITKIFLEGFVDAPSKKTDSVSTPTKDSTEN